MHTAKFLNALLGKISNKKEVKMSEIHEECGVFGAYSPKTANLSATTYLGLFALQHRGQESCGIVVNEKGNFKEHKDNGIVHDVFSPSILENLGNGNMAVGHVRYGTTGGSGRQNCQPITINHIKGRMALAHNGNLVNSLALRKELELSGSIFHTSTDTEVISYVITKERLNSSTIEQSVSISMDKLKGAYSLVLMTQTKLLAVRDPNGFRPLCFGITKEGVYIVASESCALDAVGAEFIRDIKPGEIVTFSESGVSSILDHVDKVRRQLCIFEYIYFARPDSVIEGHSVHGARVRAGEFLAKQHPIEADIVIGVPDSGIDAAIGYSRASGIPYGIGIIKNKYIGRTFIAPKQTTRDTMVKIKLNAVSRAVKGKKIVMVDDSIVRGTTSAPVVKLLREAGATEVHLRISSPPFKHPCFYGTDIDSQKNLIACRHSVKEIGDIIGVDSLDSVTSLPDGMPNEGFCTGCFDGKYCTQIPENADKTRLER